MIDKKRLQRGTQKSFLMLVDWAIIVLAYTLAFSARWLTAEIHYNQQLPYMLLAGLITVVSLYWNGVYLRLWSQTSGHGIILILQSVMASGLIIGVLNFLIWENRPLPTSVFLLGEIVGFGGLVVLRYRSRLLDAFDWRWRAIWHQEFPQTREQVLIVGAGESGQTTAWRLQHRFDDDKARYEVIGFVDDDESKRGMYVESRPILGAMKDIPTIVLEHKIDLIVVAIHKIDGARFRHILSLCEETKARIKVVPDMLAHLNATQNRTFLRDVQPEDLIGRSLVSRHDDVDLSAVMRRRVLVTGAAGSIGSELCRQICQYAPQQLLLLDNNESSLHDLQIGLMTQYPQLDIVPLLIDVTQADALSAVFTDYHPQLVFHAAAYKHVPMLERYPHEAIRVNVGGTLQLSQLSRHYEVERFVLISTDKAVEPSSVMGASKRVCELIVHALAQESTKTLFTAVRFGNVLGSRGSVVPTFNQQIDKGGPVTVTDPEMWRYFMSISEAVNLVIHAAALTKGDDLFVLQMGEEVRIVDIAERMIRLRGLRPYVDIRIDFIGMRPGEKLHEALYEDSEKPQATLHPHIMCVSQWRESDDMQDFLHRAQSLLDLTFDSSADTLAYLKQVCTGQVQEAQLY